MRLLQQFFEALEKLVEERDKKDGPELQLQLQSIYRAYFNHPSTFYYDQDAEYILNEMGQNYGGEELLTRIDMLSELLYQDVWGIERSGFFNGREKWAKGFENQRV